MFDYALENLKGIDITISKKEVLENLRKNFETHKKIVAEAKEGYKKEARTILKQAMKDVENGNFVGSVTVQLPLDNTKVYETAIKMLELHSEETIVLNAVQVRNLCMDEWDWKQGFLACNSLYSATAANM